MFWAISGLHCLVRNACAQVEVCLLPRVEVATEALQQLTHLNSNIRISQSSVIFCSRDSKASLSNSEPEAQNLYCGVQIGVQGSTLPRDHSREVKHAQKLDVPPTGFDMTSIRCFGISIVCKSCNHGSKLWCEVRL